MESVALPGGAVKETLREDLLPSTALATESPMFSINVKHIKCKLCLSVFVDPRILPCGHTFCLQCLATQVADCLNQTSFACSLCRQVYVLPKGGVDNLPKNYSLAAVTSEVKKDSSTSPAAADLKFE
jgi:ribosomal protein S27E